jgi:sulfatase-like protein
MPIHPLLVGMYPVFVLYCINIKEVAPAAIGQAVLTSFVITGLVSVFYLLVFRSWTRAALPVSFTLLLIFTYGHILNLIEGLTVAGMLIGRHRNALLVWIIISIVGLYFLAGIKTSSTRTKSLNAFSILIMAFVLIQIGIFFLQSKVAQSEQQVSLPVTDNLSSSAVERDVYYILIDAYSRQDVLHDQFDIDSSEFVNGLTELGFSIPNCAQSNYDATYPSLTSSLNMNYVDALGITHAEAHEAIYKPYIQNSLVRKSFEDLGYQTITFKSPHPPIDIKDSTYYFDYFKNSSALDQSDSLNFQHLFLSTTIFHPLISYLEGKQQPLDISPFWSAWIPTANSINSREYRQYQQNIFALETLEIIPKLAGKKFIYAHLLITHQPFVFYPDGDFHPELVQDDNAYRDQVLFANERILEIVRSILQNSDPKPIIVIQGDHSFVKGVDRVKILNAYYLPDRNNEGLYDTITPVNTFRLIFNLYFAGKYEMLPDVSRYVYSKVDNKKEIREAPSSCVN